MVGMGAYVQALPPGVAAYPMGDLGDGMGELGMVGSCSLGPGDFPDAALVAAHLSRRNRWAFDSRCARTRAHSCS